MYQIKSCIMISILNSSRIIYQKKHISPCCPTSYLCDIKHIAVAVQISKNKTREKTINIFSLKKLWSSMKGHLPCPFYYTRNTILPNLPWVIYLPVSQKAIEQHVLIAVQQSIKNITYYSSKSENSGKLLLDFVVVNVSKHV